MDSLGKIFFALSIITFTFCIGVGVHFIYQAYTLEDAVNEVPCYDDNHRVIRDAICEEVISQDTRNAYAILGVIMLGGGLFFGWFVYKSFKIQLKERELL